MSADASRCLVCGKLSARPCRRSTWCIAWARVREKLLELTFVPEVPLRRSGGRFVMGFDWKKP